MPVADPDLQIRVGGGGRGGGLKKSVFALSGLSLVYK